MKRLALCLLLAGNAVRAAGDNGSGDSATDGAAQRALLWQAWALSGRLSADEHFALRPGDFKVDPRMPSVVFPATALIEGDVLSIEPQYLNGNDYVVLQECASADCSDTRIVRVWSSIPGHPVGGGNDRRIIIPHENKYWIWAKRLPEISHPDCDTCATHFTSFKRIGPPMTITPTGEEARYRYGALLKKRERFREAREVFGDMLKREKAAPKYYRRKEREWLDAARRDLAALGPA